MSPDRLTTKPTTTSHNFFQLPVAENGQDIRSLLAGMPLWCKKKCCKKYKEKGKKRCKKCPEKN